MIKPSDIPDDLESMCQGIEWFQCGDMDKPAVAAVLNAAIEAGVVSPPVRILRSRFGVLEKGMLYVDDNEAQSHASPGGSSEHYWGQAE